MAEAGRCHCVSLRHYCAIKRRYLPTQYLADAVGHWISAYDIAGKGVANPGAMREALLLAARMGARRQGAKAHAA